MVKELNAWPLKRAGAALELRQLHAAGQNRNAFDGISEFVDLGVDLLAQIVPNCFRHLHENADYFRVELAAAEALYFLASHRNGLRCAIRTVRGDGIQRICYRENPCPHRDFISTESTRIACTVIALLVRIHDFCCLREKRNLLQHVVAPKTVLPHNFRFFRCQRTRLAQDGIWYGHLAYIVQERAAGNYPDFSPESPIARAMAMVNAVTRLECPSVSASLRSS